ncbi:hypothetical protein BDP27DRAFT_1309497 [Rhodocollybia butyracea]|uniref:Uncharacterized protein n=1 Tax=Rhodocollybia butyracea TaxID=206335 RepID=A0A9P5UGG4_9AGAR|nr:hypothetical protein BDP27DRAFT_1309497 [Rhodocollybia butyracea]
MPPPVHSTRRDHRVLLSDSECPNSKAQGHCVCVTSFLAYFILYLRAPGFHNMHMFFLPHEMLNMLFLYLYDYTYFFACTWKS